MKDFSVLIVEDDFRVADVNRQYIEAVEGFRVSGTARSGREALDFLARPDTLPDLALLDLYIPDVQGLELFRTIRNLYPDIDLIAVTAANEAGTVRGLLRGGIFDIIIKPFDADRFAKTLERYRAFREQTDGATSFSQEEIDRLTGFRGLSPSVPAGGDHLPKGIDPITLGEILGFFEESGTEGITAAELSREIGTSRSTARRYLEYLVSAGKIRTHLIYGTVGRPERRYSPL
ncbi:Transcriptional regulatory protein CitT [Bhargavaea cecembensis DSE10]|uniref:Transcriptional regulatory protein n=1 Tax=Bhargavaea cecembensis DSE10 TaxID=1235279 RepID=M7NE87_9BACL|nr:response regulator [Bhargavaea cecembensis]EMR05511.1 Transcriptional regulatory protein CitT [Bhargavaea cecembensis DSE10]